MSGTPHPTTVVLPEPINVSPLIRFGRWAALGAGIIYGAIRLQQIKKYHADIRQWQHEKAVVAAEESAKKKKWLAKEEMRYLMQVVNLPFEEGVKQFGVAELYKDE